MVTLQDALPGVLTVVPVQFSPLRTAVGRATETEPLPPVAGMEVPLGSEATTLVS
jgi:hypothetical protein